MVIKFNRDNFENKRAAYVDSVKSGDTEKQAKAFDDMLDALHSDVKSAVLEEVNSSMADSVILANRGQKVLTSEERKFFNATIEEGGFKKDVILPKSTQDRIFEDLVKAKPLLAKLGLKDYGAITEFIFSDPSGAAVWGELFGSIQGKLNSNFRKETISHYKLTAFIAISNDMLHLGPEWVERYVRTILVEALQVALEKAFVVGTGKNEPIGLNRDLAASVSHGVYTEKTSAGTLTFKNPQVMLDEMAGVMKKLAKYKKLDSEGREKSEFSTRSVAGKVVMLLNPINNYDVIAKSTVLTPAGVFVQALPFNPSVIECDFVPENKVIFFIEGKYLAIMGSEYKINKFDQTLALEDATLYTTKLFANGKALDNYAAQVYDLNITPAA